MSKKRSDIPGSHIPWQPMVQMDDEEHAISQALVKVRAMQAGVAYAGHDAYWENDRYAVFVTFWKMTDGTPCSDVQELSIKRHDKQWPNDWRDAMRIKNEIAGPEVEAVELYPAQDRIVDTANQRYLWCFPPGAQPTWDGEHVIGFPAGLRLDPDAGQIVGAVQREFDPADPERHDYDDRVGQLQQQSRR
jgi:hypothetical protein